MELLVMVDGLWDGIIRSEKAIDGSTLCFVTLHWRFITCDSQTQSIA
jgi:hypothetical protein